MASSYQSFTDLGDPPVITFPSDHNDGNSNKWRHFTEDLDFFLTKIYRYHQRSGFRCIIVDKILGLIQFVFVVSFSVFLIHLIDYACIFDRTNDAKCKLGIDPKKKLTMGDVILPFSSISLSPFEVILIIIAFIFFIFRIIKTIRSVIVNHAIKIFYHDALQVKDVTAYTWTDIQTKLIASKSKFLFQEIPLNELDIHNRILRHTNYMIALMNKGLLPVHYQVPLTDSKVTYFSKGLVFNINYLLFVGPFSFFHPAWMLKKEYKVSGNRIELANKLANNCLIFAAINLVLSPFIFFWQILTMFFAYAEVLKRDPNLILGSRNWTTYARWFCRHFNELDHQLDDRLNRGYKSATKYMNSFTDPFVEIIAKHVAFIASAILAVLICLTVYDEDVITVEHVITLMTGLGAIIALSRAFIADEIPMKQSQADLYTQILEHLHYIPYGYAPYSNQARTVMSSLFQYRLINLFEDLISPIVTPFILAYAFRYRSLEIVDFFRCFTIEQHGTGDVCMFSLLNIKENGNSYWKPSSPGSSSSTEPSSTDDVPEMKPGGDEFPPTSLAVTENGKLELSLLHFKLTNPNWSPSFTSQKRFVNYVANASSVIKDSANDVLSSPSSSSGDTSSFSRAPKMSNSGMETSQIRNPFGSATGAIGGTSSLTNDLQLVPLARERNRILAESLGDSRAGDSNIAMTLSTLFLHEMAAQQTTSSSSGVMMSQDQQLPRGSRTDGRNERDPLLLQTVTSYSSGEQPPPLFNP